MLEQRRFVCASGHLVTLVRPLREPIDWHPLPTGYAVREVEGEHEVGRRASAQYDAFRSERPFAEYQARYLRLMQSPVYRPELDIVAVAPDGQFAAFCICWLDEANRVGLFEPVGTRPAFLRQGLARAVMCEGLRRMQDAGMLSAVVCADHSNAAALSLYESLGFRRAGRILAYSKRV
jgi:ribosomal protein S18 acetylase RimI-like enzyme